MAEESYTITLCECGEQMDDEQGCPRHGSSYKATLGRVVEVVPKARLAEVERERDGLEWALSEMTGKRDKERDLELDADDLAAELRATIRATVSKGIRDEPLTDEEIAARSPALAHHHERRSAATE